MKERSVSVVVAIMDCLGCIRPQTNAVRGKCELLS